MVKGFHDCMCFYYISSAFVGVSTFFLISWFLYHACITCTIMHLLIKSVDLTRTIVTIGALFFFIFTKKNLFRFIYFKKNITYILDVFYHAISQVFYIWICYSVRLYFYIKLIIIYFIVMFCLFFNGRAILSIFKILWGKLNSTSQISKCFIILYIVYIIRKEYWPCFSKYTIKIMKKELLLL